MNQILQEGIAKLQQRAGWVRLIIYAFVGLNLAEIAVDFAQLAGLIVLSEGSLTADLAALVYLTSYISLLISIVLVAMWIHRSHANLFAADFEGLEFTPGWSVGWFFVPFANLIQPYNAMREVWLRSHGEESRDPGPDLGALKIWWGCFLAGNIANNISARLTGDNFELGTAALVTGLIGAALSVGSAWFLLKIVEAVTYAQRNFVGVAQAFA